MESSKKNRKLQSGSLPGISAKSFFIELRDLDQLANKDKSIKKIGDAASRYLESSLSLAE